MDYVWVGFWKCLPEFFGRINDGDLYYTTWGNRMECQ